MKESWQDIKGFEGRYRISSTGQIHDIIADLRFYPKTDSIILTLDNNCTLKTSVSNILKTQFPTKVEYVVQHIELPKPMLCINGVNYFSYKDASSDLKLKVSTIKRRVLSETNKDYYEL